MPRKLNARATDDVRAEVIKISADDAVLSKKVGIIENLESRILRDMIIQTRKELTAALPPIFVRLLPSRRAAARSRFRAVQPGNTEATALMGDIRR